MNFPHKNFLNRILHDTFLRDKSSTEFLLAKNYEHISEITANVMKGFPCLTETINFLHRLLRFIGENPAVKIFLREIFPPPLFDSNVVRKTEDYSRRKIFFIFSPTQRRKKKCFSHSENFPSCELEKEKRRRFYALSMNMRLVEKLAKIFMQLNMEKLSYHALDLAQFTHSRG